MTIKDCPICGGTHYGSHKCPYTLAPCCVCGDDTIWACSDCGINSAGKQSVHVCGKSECRDTHEQIHRAPNGPAEVSGAGKEGA